MFFGLRIKQYAHCDDYSAKTTQECHRVAKQDHRKPNQESTFNCICHAAVEERKIIGTKLWIENIFKTLLTNVEYNKKNLSTLQVNDGF